jgi:hypothetical protein
MICAPVPRTWRGVTPLIEPAVPTGMNAGVSTVPCGVCNRPQRAAPEGESEASTISNLII